MAKGRAGRGRGAMTLNLQRTLPFLSMLAGLALGILAGCAAQPRTNAAPEPQAKPSSFKLQTTAFKPGGTIPKKFSCEGSDDSPGLAWTEPPAGTASFALTMDDPDAPAGTWVHWVVYDLPPSARQLQEAMPKGDDAPGGGRQGVNDFEKTGYGGP